MLQRKIHRVRTGGTGRHPSLTDTLYIGANPYGKRGGTSGEPVDAVAVATGTACGHPALVALTSETLIDLAKALGHPVDGREAKKLAKAGALFNDLTAQVMIVKLKEASHA